MGTDRVSGLAGHRGHKGCRKQALSDKTRARENNPNRVHIQILFFFPQLASDSVIPFTPLPSPMYADQHGEEFSKPGQFSKGTEDTYEIATDHGAS